MKKIFTSQKITLVANGTEFRFQALVSRLGAKYVFEDAEIPAEVKQQVGKEVTVLYKNIPVKSKLMRESTRAGIVFSLRFLDPSTLLVAQIEKDISETGLPSPWRRSLPRLTTEAKNIPNPALAVLSYGNQTHFLKVIDFTLGGLQLQFIGDDLNSVRVGTAFDFDIVINTGDKIADMRATVSHITIESHAGASDEHYFGVKLLPLSVAAETKYRSLIRDHCLGLRQQLERQISSAS